MTQPAVRLESTPLLAKLLKHELSDGAIARSLGAKFVRQREYWGDALLKPLANMAERQGKELRARLVIIAWKMAGAEGEVPDVLIGIVEALHLGSLIVDDIEDGSTTRRGGPTLHDRIGLPLALNAANWLYFWPTLLIDRLRLAPHQELHLRRTIEQHVLLCHFGQALDLSLRVCDLKQSEVLEAVRSTSELKTGCLMELASRAGAIVGGADAATVEELGKLGRNLGLALQMLDDLTSITSERRAEKGREDLNLGRPTWPWAWLAQQSDEMAYGRLRALEELVLEGKVDSDIIAATLRVQIGALGRAEIRRLLGESLAQTRGSLGERAGMSDLLEWIRELEGCVG